MARIRSIHPGIFTDEAFVTLSDSAQIFLIALWTEADDQGIFEWKPVTLRMRLRPTKDGDVAPFLDELCAANIIKIYEIDGRKLGAIRNFRRFQRPKSPNSIHPINDEIRKYVGLSAPNGETAQDEVDPFPQNGEMSAQMEDGGGRREDGEEEVKKKERKQGRASRAAAGGHSSDVLAFEGAVVRLKQKDFDRWKLAYRFIPDLPAALTKADDYYRDNPPKNGKLFFSVSRWLEKENTEAQRQQIRGEYGVDRW